MSVENTLNMSYEDAYDKMENILNKLERCNISLDESLKLYEEGINLYKYCAKILEEAELKVSKFNEVQEEVEF